MAVEIKLAKGNILPFRSITVFSPTEAAALNVIAMGELIPSDEAAGEEGKYQYLGPVENFIEATGVHKVAGPVINHGKPAGNAEAVIQKIDFPEEGTIYISKSGPLGNGMFGVWGKVE